MPSSRRRYQNCKGKPMDVEIDKTVFQRSVSQSDWNTYGPSGSAAACKRGALDESSARFFCVVDDSHCVIL